jgi:hypothetical protein
MTYSIVGNAFWYVMIIVVDNRFGISYRM